MENKAGDMNGEFVIHAPTPHDTRHHPEICEQAQNIREIAQALVAQDKASAVRDNTVLNMCKSLDGIEAAMKEQTQLLRDVGLQDLRIGHLEKNGANTEEHFTELFNRMRELEKTAAGNTAAVKLEIIEGLVGTEGKMVTLDKQVDRILLVVDTVSSRPFLALLGLLITLILIGTACDFVFHQNLTERLFSWVPKP